MWGERRRWSIACVQPLPPLRKDRRRGWGKGAAVLRLWEARCGEGKWKLTRAFSCHSNWRGCYQSITFLGGRARSLFGEPVYASNVLYLMAPRLVFHPFQPTLGNITTLRHSHLPDTKKCSQTLDATTHKCTLRLRLVETLILYANTTNTKQLSLPEKLPGLSRNKPMARFDFNVQCNHLLARISAFLTSSLTSLSPSSLPLKPPAILGSMASAGFVETSQQLTLKKQIRFSVNFPL